MTEKHIGYKPGYGIKWVIVTEPSSAFPKAVLHREWINCWSGESTWKAVPIEVCGELIDANEFRCGMGNLDPQEKPKAIGSWWRRLLRLK